ncbi:hypothetical protein RFI_21764, partial [Reticulomyxa filosa]
VVFGIGSTGAPLIIDLSVSLWNSYKYAIYLLGGMSCVIAVLLKSLSPTSDHLIGPNTVSPYLKTNTNDTSEHKYLFQNTDSKNATVLTESYINLPEPILLNLDQSIIESASKPEVENDFTMEPYNKRSNDLPQADHHLLPYQDPLCTDAGLVQITCWKYVVIALSAITSFFAGGLQFALNSFITGFVDDNLGLPKSVGRSVVCHMICYYFFECCSEPLRDVYYLNFKIFFFLWYLNSTYFGAQLLGRFGTMYVMHKQLQASNVLLCCNGMMGVAMAVFALFHSHLLALYASFAMDGWFAASVIATSLKFADDIVGNNGFVSALYLASFNIGGAAISFAIGWGIDTYGYIFFPWACLALSIANVIVYFFCWLICKICSPSVKYETVRIYSRTLLTEPTCVSPM